MGTPPNTGEALHEETVSTHGLGSIQMMGLGAIAMGAAVGVARFRKFRTHHHEERMLA